MRLIASNRFLKFKKKFPPRLQLEIDNQVQKILENPNIGVLKKEDLKGIRVYKFTFNSHLFLISYECKEDVLYLYVIGSHENFYKKLKRLIR